MQVTRLSLLRPDCIASNQRLCAYYESMGFIKKVAKQMPHSLNNLYEKPFQEDFYFSPSVLQYPRCCYRVKLVFANKVVSGCVYFTIPEKFCNIFYPDSSCSLPKYQKWKEQV